MRVLFVSPRPPNHLHRIRSLNIAKALHGVADVHLACLYNNTDELTYLKVHASLYKSVSVVHHPFTWAAFGAAREGLLRRSLHVGYCLSSRFAAVLQRLSQQHWDVVYIKRLRLATYASIFDPATVWIDLTDSLAMYYDRAIQVRLRGIDAAVCRLEREPIRVVERDTVARYRTIFCSPVDREYCRTAEDNRSYVIPNAVDISEFAAKQVPSRLRSLGFWGLMDVPMNYTACELVLQRIWPRLRQRSLEYTLKIVGPRPPGWLQRLKSAGVSFLGHVADLSSVLQAIDALVCPIVVGAGVKNRILQALASNVPVFTTTMGAEGIHDATLLRRNGWLIVEDDLEAYPDLIEQWSPPPDSFSPHELVKTHYSLQTLRDTLLTTLS